MPKITMFVFLMLFSTQSFSWSISCTTKGNQSWCYLWFVDEKRVTGKKKKIKIAFYTYKGEVETSTICKNQTYGSLEI